MTPIKSKSHPPPNGYVRGGKHLMLAALLCVASVLSAQEGSSFQQVFTLNSDNDAFAAWRNRDRYYTYGLEASLAFRYKKFLGLQNWVPRKEGFFMKAHLHSEGYTPSVKIVTLAQIQGDSLITFDRPFAGLLYGNLSNTYTMERSFLRTSIMAGIMGPSSGAGDLQRWVHDNVTDDDVFDAWRYQLPDQLILNLAGDYFLDLSPEARWAGFYGGLQARVGNLYIDTTPTVGLRIGRFNSMNSSAAFDNELLAGRRDWELYFHSRFSATWALFNATAQGRLFGPKYQYALDEINPFFFAMSHGIYFVRNHVIIGYEQSFRYGEVLEGQRHVYARLDLRYRF